VSKLSLGRKAPRRREKREKRFPLHLGLLVGACMSAASTEWPRNAASLTPSAVRTSNDVDNVQAALAGLQVASLDDLPDEAASLEELGVSDLLKDFGQMHLAQSEDGEGVDDEEKDDEELCFGDADEGELHLEFASGSDSEDDALGMDELSGSDGDENDEAMDAPGAVERDWHPRCCREEKHCLDAFGEGW
jgi:hypothetical protein